MCVAQRAVAAMMNGACHLRGGKLMNVDTPYIRDALADDETCRAIDIMLL